MGAQPSPIGTRVGPLAFAIGIAVLLVGVLVNPLLIAPIGGAITVAAGFAWAHDVNHATAGAPSVPAGAPIPIPGYPAAAISSHRRRYTSRPPM